MKIIMTALHYAVAGFGFIMCFIFALVALSFVDGSKSMGWLAVVLALVCGRIAWMAWDDVTYE